MSEEREQYLDPARGPRTTDWRVWMTTPTSDEPYWEGHDSAESAVAAVYYLQHLASWFGADATTGSSPTQLGILMWDYAEGSYVHSEDPLAP